eukprot:2318340-Rhodomonas_salina.1
MREAEREFGSGHWVPAVSGACAGCEAHCSTRLAAWPRHVWRQDSTGPRISCARTRRMIAGRVVPDSSNVLSQRT